MRRSLVLFFTILTLNTISYSQTEELPPLEQLVKKYAPILRHHINESHLTSSVEWFLERSQLNRKKGYGYLPFFDKWVYSDQSDVICNLSNPDCVSRLSNEAKYTGSSHADILENKRWFISPPYSSGPLGIALGEWQYGDLNSSKAYVHIKIAHYQNMPRFDYDIEIQYWFFWPHNPALAPSNWGQHEGDWEGVSVILNSDGNMKYIIPTSHGDRNYYSSSQIEKDGTQPVIYVAKSSHALYYKNGSYGFLGSDKTNGRKGIKELNSSNAYEIIEIDPRIKNHGINYDQPEWIKFGGKWGGTYSDRAFFGFDDSNSPAFPKYDYEEWSGRYHDPIELKDVGILDIDFTFPPFPYDYEFPLNAVEPNQISGSSSLCSNNNYTYSIGINKPKSTKWSAPASYFTPSSSQSNTFVTTVQGSGSNKKIEANVTIRHNIGSETVYKTKHNFSKSVSISNPTSSNFYLSKNTTPSGSNYCLTKVSLVNNSGVSVSSVKWSVTSGLTLGYKNNSYANITSSNGSSGTATAEVTVCGKKIIVSTLLYTSCTSDGGGCDGGIEFQSNELKDSNTIYPNPTTGQAKIAIIKPCDPHIQYQMIVSDQSGKTIKVQDYDVNKSYIDINLLNEKNGIYFIQVLRNNEPIYKGKLIKN